MLDRLKRYGEMAVALTAISAVFSLLISIFGGHLPPWATFAWAQTQEQLEQQNARQISQLNALILSDKVSMLAAAVSKNPSDPNLQASLRYWQMQLNAAQATTLPQIQRK